METKLKEYIDQLNEIKQGLYNLYDDAPEDNPDLLAAISTASIDVESAVDSLEALF